MKLPSCLICVMVLISGASQVYAVTLTFDDIPDGAEVHSYYDDVYGLIFNGGFTAAEHTGSTWGPPHSGNNVLVWSLDLDPLYFPRIWVDMKRPSAARADTVGGYFSTELGVVLEIIGYRSAIYEDPVAFAVIGAPGESWNNVYVQIGSQTGMGIVEFRSVTPHALSHFSADDLTVDFVPEPASLLALGVGLAGLALRRKRRR